MSTNTGKFRPEKKQSAYNSSNLSNTKEDTAESRLTQALENDAIDSKYGFDRVRDHVERTGFLLNMHTTEILDEDKRLIAAVDYYFMEEDGTRFKVSYPFMPYFYILTRKECLKEITQFLQKKFAGTVAKMEEITKEDLDLLNHLMGLKQRYLKLSFLNQTDLIKVRKELLSAVRKNKEREKANTFYTEMLSNALANRDEVAHPKFTVDQMENILDIREYDVPYHTRVSIDLKIFCGSWYNVKCKGATIAPPAITLRSDLIERPEPIVLAYDIETTKLPLKFPDVNTDQIMMISYMIDAQGYLITNREILSADIADFEYTPKPEFEGRFTIFNEPNEKALIQKFFDHILEVRPHIFVTYNGDFFDWPFVEGRATIHELDMKQEIGFYKGKEGVYMCRPAMHMDCLCWVKRDSYLPIGSQNLKAVAKAKLRYDPVELDPEEMCPLAASDPQVLSNYSVSDAVATYYLYMQYVHPFIFALCTIIPCEPDEVLRKGSGTLCEALLMVEAFHANIVFPNKQETELNKLTDDGHVLHQETYVGGHVEALESGVFRADIPCRFRLSPEILKKLIAEVPRALAHAIEVEEGVPMSLVTNLQEIEGEIVEQLQALHDIPCRMERPLIYHLDVGAMYPNIILTNRLQPCAMVNETICASCDFNKPGAHCQRNMAWMWRAEYMPASKNEYHRIQQQLETEKFPPMFPGGPQRAFHQLSRLEQAELEKKRLSEYCRKAYKKTKVTKVEERTTTICQKENSFYVDTVRAFRDRRYEYKGLSKKAKQQVSAAIKGGDATEIKSAKNREVLYDSLQLAHKCILNSFYGYVMRRGARWHSMEMAGIVCYTGANIIMKAREIIEQVGRPLELDTDGIWCILPASFPENVTVHTTHPSKKKLIISYPNAVLNAMVKEYFTNDQYHELVNPTKLEYQVRNENSIFFEVDGPYKAMVLPASKEEGKKLKKRYAVFNFDGSLAELKGFEVKRRGELQLIKNFQSSVFEAFLKGNSLETCYAAVAQVADYWLDVLFSHGKNMPDSELFDLISENRSMSKKLEEYGAQKSTSISTAKRLAEFLGDQMVKDAGLACKFIISKKPDGAPVTERAIPLAIFQAEDAVKKHFLRKWLKDQSIGNIDIRDVLDWGYYIERLGGTIQKIVTIPAAMQGLANPVPRVKHPDWLHKKMLERNDNFKQRRINEMFSVAPKPIAAPRVENGDTEAMGDVEAGDIEDFGNENNANKANRPLVTKRKRSAQDAEENDYNKSWREALGPPPPFGKNREENHAWLLFQKKKWKHQSMQRLTCNQPNKKARNNAGMRTAAPGTLGGFLQRAQRTLLTNIWQVVQISPTSTPGEFRMWALVHSELHMLKLVVPRTFYANLRTPKCADEGALFKKCNRTLPRSGPVFNLYMYTVPESLFVEHGKKVYIDQSDQNVEGVYETQVTPLFRALMQIGCVCRLSGKTTLESPDCFTLDQLEIANLNKQSYLEGDSLKRLYLYQHRASSGVRQMFALFLTPIRKAVVIVVDSVRTNLMPNMNTLYQSERIAKLEKNPNEKAIPPEEINFEVRVETEIAKVYKFLQRALQSYKDEKKGPTLLAIQCQDDIETLQTQMPGLAEFPQTQIHVKDLDDLYSSLEWQKVGARTFTRHYLNSEKVLNLMTDQSRYFYLPLGNMPADPALFGTDLFYGRNLIKQNHVLWCSKSDRPDLGGSQENDTRLLAESQEGSSEVCNSPGWYSSVCVELDIDSLAINTLLQSHHVHDIEGTSSATAFDAVNAASLDDLIAGGGANAALTVYDETARCAEAFKILRSMASIWMRDITLYRNLYADFQVVHFYRWLRSPKAMLYDPALLRTLQNLMKKLFMQLVAEFKRLGCTIVYANFNKIIICTRKHNVTDGLENVEFVVASIRNKELFHSLEITYRQCWETLVWLDPANFAGVPGKVSNKTADKEQNIGAEDVGDEGEENGPQENEHTIVMNWNLAEQLPEKYGCRKNFSGVIANYINSVHTKMVNTQITVGLITESQPSLGLAAHKNLVEFAQEILVGDLSQTLFQITERIREKFPARGDVNPALDFVKAVCHVLSLDSSIESAVQTLKSNLLRLIGIGEFSDRAIWKDQSVSYTIPQLICKACNHCRDVDLGRDPYRSDVSWLCPLCNTAYDNSEIESFLLDTISRKFLAYNLQDLQCKKCAQIKMDNLMKHCKCAGDFRGLLSSEDFVLLLKKFLSLAGTFNMYAVQETVEHILTLV